MAPRQPQRTCYLLIGQPGRGQDVAWLIALRRTRGTIGYRHHVLECHNSGFRVDPWDGEVDCACDGANGVAVHDHSERCELSHRRGLDRFAVALPSVVLLE